MKAAEPAALPKVDIASIPADVKEQLVIMAFRSMCEYMQQPGNKEKLEARIAANREKE